MRGSLSCGFPLTMFSVCQSCLDLLTSLESELNFLSASPQPFLVFVNLITSLDEHIARKDEME